MVVPFPVVVTGSGKLSWTEEDDLKSTNLVHGDVYRLQQGSVFFVQSNLETTETERQKLRIHAIFANSNFDLHVCKLTHLLDFIQSIIHSLSFGLICRNHQLDLILAFGIWLLALTGRFCKQLFGYNRFSCLVYYSLFGLLCDLKMIRMQNVDVRFRQQL